MDNMSESASILPTKGSFAPSFFFANDLWKTGVEQRVGGVLLLLSLQTLDSAASRQVGPCCCRCMSPHTNSPMCTRGLS